MRRHGPRLYLAQVSQVIPMHDTLDLGCSSSVNVVSQPVSNHCFSHKFMFRVLQTRHGPHKLLGALSSASLTGVSACDWYQNK